MIYLEEICKYVNPNKVRWYFNMYDWKNNPEYIEKVRKLGFKIRICRRWRNSHGDRV